MSNIIDTLHLALSRQSITTAAPAGIAGNTSKNDVTVANILGVLREYKPSIEKCGAFKYHPEDLGQLKYHPGTSPNAYPYLPANQIIADWWLAGWSFDREGTVNETRIAA